MATSSSSESDSSSSRSTSPEPDNKQKQKLKATLKAKDESEDTSSSSGSESESESTSSNEMDTSEDVAQGGTPGKRVHISGPQPYKPPMGFKSAKKQPPPSSNSSSILSNLRGKQVIHLTAPSFLPLSKVKEISMSKIIKGEPILSYEGVSYGIPAESLNEAESQDKALLIYDQNTQTYRRQADHIWSYHIQEMVGVPGVDQATVEALRDTVKPPRPQPKNLKMRFRPVGSLPAPPETLGSSSESEADEPSFKVPAGEREERKRKHHHTEVDSTQAASLPRKKSKKHSSQETKNAEHESKKSKKSHKEREEKKRKKAEKA